MNHFLISGYFFHFDVITRQLFDILILSLLNILNLLLYLNLILNLGKCLTLSSTFFLSVRRTRLRTGTQHVGEAAEQSSRGRLFFCCLVHSLTGLVLTVVSGGSCSGLEGRSVNLLVV